MKKCWFDKHIWKALSSPYFVKLDDFGRTGLVKPAECENCGKKELRKYHGVHSGVPKTKEKIWDEVKKGEYTGG